MLPDNANRSTLGTFNFDNYSHLHITLNIKSMANRLYPKALRYILWNLLHCLADASDSL